MSELKQYNPATFPDHISIQGSFSKLMRKVVALSSTNLKGMNAVPVSVLAAPGAGFLLWVARVGFEMVRTATAYANGGTINLQYHTTTTVVPHSGTIPATALTTSGAGTTFTVLGPDTSANGIILPANEGIDITNGTAPFITGTGVAYLYIHYSLVQLQ